mgnify:FL=1
MRLLLENWRKYLNEAEASVVYGPPPHKNPSEEEMLALGAFPTYKLPKPIPYRLVTGPKTIQTLEGPISIPDGETYYVWKGEKENEYWAQPPKEAQEKYIVDKPEKGQGTPRQEDRYAVRMPGPFQVKVSWSKDLLSGDENHFLVRYGDGDFGVVESDIFMSTYDISRMNKK